MKGHVLAATGRGLGQVLSQPRLVVLVWLIHLAVAAAATYPFWRTLAQTLGPLPEGDVLGSGIPLGALADLAELRPGLISGFELVVVAVAALGLVLGAAVSAGTLEVLRSGDARRLGHRFGRGAGRFFARFLGVGLVVGTLGGLAGAVVLGPILALARQSFRSSGEPGAALILGGAAGACVVAVLTLLVLDVSRILVVRDDRGVLASVRTALALVFRRPGVWMGTWLVNAALVSVAAGLYVAVRDSLPAAAPLLALVATHQLFILTRTALRIALLATQSTLVESFRGGALFERDDESSDPGEPTRAESPPTSDPTWPQGPSSPE